MQDHEQGDKVMLLIYYKPNYKYLKEVTQQGSKY